MAAAPELEVVNRIDLLRDQIFGALEELTAGWTQPLDASTKSELEELCAKFRRYVEEQRIHRDN